MILLPLPLASSGNSLSGNTSIRPSLDTAPRYSVFSVVGMVSGGMILAPLGTLTTALPLRFLLIMSFSDVTNP